MFLSSILALGREDGFSPYSDKPSMGDALPVNEGGRGEVEGRTGGERVEKSTGGGREQERGEGERGYMRWDRRKG
jgi:hypothetical protein